MIGTPCLQRVRGFVLLVKLRCSVYGNELICHVLRGGMYDANHEDVYRELRLEINKMPVPYLEVVSRVELRLLKHLFTPGRS